MIDPEFEQNERVLCKKGEMRSRMSPAWYIRVRRGIIERQRVKKEKRLQREREIKCHSASA